MDELLNKELTKINPKRFTKKKLTILLHHILMVRFEDPYISSKILNLNEDDIFSYFYKGEYLQNRKHIVFEASYLSFFWERYIKGREYSYNTYKDTIDSMLLHFNEEYFTGYIKNSLKIYNYTSHYNLSISNKLNDYLDSDVDDKYKGTIKEKKNIKRKYTFYHIVLVERSCKLQILVQIDKKKHDVNLIKSMSVNNKQSKLNEIFIKKFPNIKGYIESYSSNIFGTDEYTYIVIYRLNKLFTKRLHDEFLWLNITNTNICRFSPYEKDLIFYLSQIYSTNEHIKIGYDGVIFK